MSRELDVFLHFFFLAFALLSWRYTLPRNRRLAYIYFIGMYLLATCIGDGLAATIMLNRYLAKTLVSNLFLYHLLVPVQYAIIALIYGSVISNDRIRRWIRFSIPVFLLLSFGTSISIQGIKEYNSYATLLKHGLVIVFVLIYFRELILDTPYAKIYHQPIFWISLGFLFHSALNIMLEGVSNYLQTYGKHQYDVVYFLYSTSNYCLFLLFGIGFLTSPKMEGDK
ncbi:MAG: hypothetical protein DI538_14500 [Azospira oryzae]|nr:MAG: hypothetical protein DI538_14500 [Azospira oryzae]